MVSNPNSQITLRLNDVPLSDASLSPDKPDDHTSPGPVQDSFSIQSSQDLGGLLRAHEVENINQIPFWPYSLLQKLVTRERVCKVLQSMDGKKVATICDSIAPEPERLNMGSQNKYLRVFVLLVLLEKENDIEKFIREELHDGKLPLQYEVRRNPPKCFGGWKIHEIEHFLVHQRSVMVQYFEMGADGSANHYEIKSETMLPWLEEKGEAMEGGYGVVQKYKIDADSHGFKPILERVKLDSKWVAVKRLKKPKFKTDKKAFEREVGNLQKFNGLKKTALITLLATYTLGNHYHFIFPAAEYDLETFWEKNKGPLSKPGAIDLPILGWIASQIQSLISALEYIHNPEKHLNMKHLDTGLEPKYGRHGDLKPENILWFESPASEHGIFVIADLGIADIHRDQSKSNIPNTGLPVSPGYRPPECDIDRGKISRAFDVWTLGCVLLEMASWLLGGDEARKKFKQDRTSPFITGAKTDIFFDIVPLSNDKYGVKIKDQVIKYIDSLHRNAGCSSYIHDLLDLIQKDMLVVLKDKNSRKEMSKILPIVNKMTEKARSSSDYIAQPQPATRVTPAQEPHAITPSKLLQNWIRDKELLRKDLGETHQSSYSGQSYESTGCSI